MGPDEEKPPLRPRIEQLGEKVGAVVLIVAVFVAFIFLLTKDQGLDVGYMQAHWGSLLPGLLITIQITVYSYFSGMVIGFGFGWMRTLRYRIPRGLATIWVESFRGTPLFVQLLLLFGLFSYYNPGNLPTDSRLLLTGYFALMLNTSGYQAEIFRAGLQSVAAGQVEAAKSIGLPYWGAMRSVIMPQAVRIVVPPLTNEFISILKASSLLFYIAIHELTYDARVLTFAGGKIVEVYIMLSVTYLALTIPLSKVVSYFERRFRIPGLGVQQERLTRRTRSSTRFVTRVFGTNGTAIGLVTAKVPRNRAAQRPNLADTSISGIFLRGPRMLRRPW